MRRFDTDTIVTNRAALAAVTSTGTILTEFPHDAALTLWALAAVTGGAVVVVVAAVSLCIGFWYINDAAAGDQTKNNTHAQERYSVQSFARREHQWNSSHLWSICKAYDQSLMLAKRALAFGKNR